ncbi:hypothetical protein HRbin36_00138 [bacterium HR36]|nr:hypothetical protein HRbin36_00138 [bacterium HR36]
MSATAAVWDRPKVTPKDLLKLPKDRRCELVNGKLVGKTMATTAVPVAGEVFGLLRQYVKERDLGLVLMTDASYRCFPGEPDKMRKPDVSFIRRERITLGLWEPGHIRMRPDLVVEVVSPHDEVSDVGRRIQDYLRAGVPLIWVVHPEPRHVYVYRPGGRGETLGEQDELTGEPVLPGLRLAVREIFVPLERYAQVSAQQALSEPKE